MCLEWDICLDWVIFRQPEVWTLGSYLLLMLKIFSLQKWLPSSMELIEKDFQAWNCSTSNYQQVICDKMHSSRPFFIVHCICIFLLVIHFASYNCKFKKEGLHSWGLFCCKVDINNTCASLKDVPSVSDSLLVQNYDIRDVQIDTS